jgi:hypothetical protein
MLLRLDIGTVIGTLFEIRSGDVSIPWCGGEDEAWVEKYTQEHRKI